MIYQIIEEPLRRNYRPLRPQLPLSLTLLHRTHPQCRDHNLRRQRLLLTAKLCDPTPALQRPRRPYHLGAQNRPRFLSRAHHLLNRLPPFHLLPHRPIGNAPPQPLPSRSLRRARQSRQRLRRSSRRLWKLRLPPLLPLDPRGGRGCRYRRLRGTPEGGSREAVGLTGTEDTGSAWSATTDGGC